MIVVVPAVVMWELWKQRNTRRHGGEVNIYKLQRNCMELLHKIARRKHTWIDIPREWSGIVQVLGEYRPKLHYLLVKWEKPAQRKIKYNTDGVSRGNPGDSAYSFCLRDERGLLIHAQAEPICITTNMKAEIRAIKEAVRYCKVCKIRDVIIEIDFLVSMKMIKTEWKIPWHSEEDIHHIQQIMQEIDIDI